MCRGGGNTGAAEVPGQGRGNPGGLSEEVTFRRSSSSCSTGLWDISKGRALVTVGSPCTCPFSGHLVPLLVDPSDLAWSPHALTVLQEATGVRSCLRGAHSPRMSKK